MKVRTRHSGRFETMEARQLLSGATYYVSPSGSDTAAGTSDGAAFATLQRAANAVLADVASAGGAAGDTVVVRAGTYSAGFQMGYDTPAAGTAAAPIRFVADAGATIAGRNNKTPDGIDLEGGCDYVTVQ